MTDIELILYVILCPKVSHRNQLSLVDLLMFTSYPILDLMLLKASMLLNNTPPCNLLLLLSHVFLLTSLRCSCPIQNLPARTHLQLSLSLLRSSTLV